MTDMRFVWQRFVGAVLYAVGWPYNISSGIHGGITCGYGELDNNGFWQYPAPRKVERMYERWD